MNGWGNPVHRIYTLNLAIVALLAASLIVPRLLPRGGGFAPTQAATLVIVTTLLAALALAMVQAIYTMKRRHSLVRHHVILGMLPIVLAIVLGIGITAFLRY